MSKKQGKSLAQKKAAQIVEQQKDPMLRALQKKVRNINKKLTQIAELEAKKDLKPQQEQKINKKPLIEKQKQKYQEMIQLYKEIAIENKQILRKSQLTQLQDLSAIIALKEYSVDIGAQHNQSVDKLLRVLTTPSSPDLSLSQRINEVKEAIVSTANNPKLKKAVKEYVDANPAQKKVNAQSISDEPQPLSPRSQQQREAQLKQLQQQEEKNESAKKLEGPLSPQIAQEKPSAQSNIETPNQSKPANAQEEQQQLTEQKKVEVTEAKQQQQAKQDEEKGESPNDKKNQRREHRGNNRGNYRGRGQGDEQRKNYKKPSFKPKYEEKNKKQEVQKRDSSLSSSSSDSEPKARQFKRQQIKELINDGFIVVGKPKIKGRDQREYHEHQHGNKQHHKPHTKKNY